MNKADKTDLIAGMMLMHLAEDLEEVTGNAEGVIADPEEDIEAFIPIVNSILDKLTPEQRLSLEQVCLRMASLVTAKTSGAAATEIKT